MAVGGQDGKWSHFHLFLFFEPSNTKMKAKKKLPIEKWPQILERLLRPQNPPKIVDNLMFLIVFRYIF